MKQEYIRVWLFSFALFVAPAAAQNYSFSVPELKMQVFVQPDASARIVYNITFQNSPGARAIDVVDIGTPHGRYAISNMKASVYGIEATDIRPSEYVKPGVEVHLPQLIPPGGQGTLHFEFTMPDMVYQDTTRRDYASLRMTPTWFGGEFVTGTTDLQIAVFTLPGIQPQEVLYQKTPFTNKATYEGRVVAFWGFPQARATGPRIVGVSFPKRGMERVVRMTKFGLLVKWFKESPQARVWAGVLFLVLFGFLFFRFSGGTGFAVFVPLVIGLIILFAVSPSAHLVAFLPLAAFIFLNERHLRRRGKRYLPPIAQVEGGGIKRGLTAPEAAVLLEMPLSKVLTLVIFGLLKKGVLRQVQAVPLVVEVAAEFSTTEKLLAPRRRAAHRRRAAQQKGCVVHNYENPFLDALEANAGKPVADIDLSSPVKELIKHTAARVKGFDLSDTQDYYRHIIRRALREAQSIGDISKREQVLDRDFEWILLDDDYPTVFVGRDYSYEPTWTRPTGGEGGVGVPSAPSAPSPGGRTTFGDVAASFAGWTENTMGSMANAIAPGSLNIEGVRGGIVDLSGVDHVTGDILKALSEASTSGSGGGCACACAGCACACACAGGGR